MRVLLMEWAESSKMYFSHPMTNNSKTVVMLEGESNQFAALHARLLMLARRLVDWARSVSRGQGAAPTTSMGPRRSGSEADNGSPRRSSGGAWLGC